MIDSCKCSYKIGMKEEFKESPYRYLKDGLVEIYDDHLLFYAKSNAKKTLFGSKTPDTQGQIPDGKVTMSECIGYKKGGAFQYHVILTGDRRVSITLQGFQTQKIEGILNRFFDYAITLPTSDTSGAQATPAPQKSERFVPSGMEPTPIDPIEAAISGMPVIPIPKALEETERQGDMPGVSETRQGDVPSVSKHIAQDQTEDRGAQKLVWIHRLGPKTSVKQVTELIQDFSNCDEVAANQKALQALSGPAPIAVYESDIFMDSMKSIGCTVSYNKEIADDAAPKASTPTMMAPPPSLNFDSDLKPESKISPFDLGSAVVEPAAPIVSVDVEPVEVAPAAPIDPVEVKPMSAPPLKVDFENRIFITCPICGQRTEKGKFCMACGQRMHKFCAECGFQNPANAKFCAKCGTPMID